MITGATFESTNFLQRSRHTTAPHVHRNGLPDDFFSIRMRQVKISNGSAELKYISGNHNFHPSQIIAILQIVCFEWMAMWLFV
mmetsp:Transcript_23401/g.38455  ORF Transcript_23401/g.38455 Transcript_23401/m.38455 type:complete len:83 (-) Transcript_23401:319-567(-)